MTTIASWRDLLHTDAYLDGSWRATTERFAVDDPATGETVAEVARCGATETGAAIAAAEQAQPAWAAMLARERGAVLRRWAALLNEHAAPLAELLCRENGKPLAEGLGEVAYAAGFLDWFGEQARRVDGSVIPTFAADKRVVALRQPVGVAAAITPWNFPAAMLTRKIGPALAVGCTLVAKPAEQTPLTALALAALGERAGVPLGVFNVVTGAGGDAPVIGEAITASPVVRKLSFTGSTEVGKLLAARCAATVKRVSLELGGNAPFLVFDDADLDAAVAGTLVAKFRNSGQTCVAANRILVQRSVHDAYLERLQAAISALAVGRFDEPGVAVGPLIDDAGLAKVRRLVDDARAGGAAVLLGGEQLDRPGRFFAPTLLRDVDPAMSLSCEEAFGPVAAVGVFDTEEEAILRANDTRAGLAAYCYTRDVGRVWRVGEALEYGMVGINTGFISSPEVPFGGVKESGLGREGSQYGIEDWTEVKYLAIGL
ncbi:MAG: NAD-dependent succinate-semialdehyde dehydrogenase [Acidimicrobiales bacterium]